MLSLITEQAHAKVVSLFLQNGMQEAMQSHEVPECALSKTETSSPVGSQSNKTTIVLASLLGITACVAVGGFVFLFAYFRKRQGEQKRPFQTLP